MPKKISDKQQAQDLLDSYDTFLFDCDGVLWSGSTLLPHAAETIALLHKHGKRLVFVTNNSTKSRQAYAQKFAGFGIEVEPSEIFGSSYSTAVYLDKVAKLPKTKKVYVIGESGIEEELKNVGFEVVGGTDPEFQGSDRKADTVDRDESIGCVVAALDTHMTYYKIAYAQQQLIDPETLFLATNIDSTFPNGGKLLPGAGTIIRAVATCSGREPTPLGKPSDEMMDCIKAEFEFDPARAVMVGDRLNTDIEFGKKGGLGTLFVLTGVDTESSLKASKIQPDFYADKLGDLYELLA